MMQGRLVLTSFADQQRERWAHAFSVARWQPRWMEPKLPELDLLKPLDAMKHMAPADYQAAYEHVLLNRADRVREFYRKLRGYVDKDGLTVTLVCWCSAERQAAHPTFYCHTLLIGWPAEALLGLTVVYRDGRDRPPAFDRGAWVRWAEEVDLCGLSS